ncbi:MULTISPECIES: ABC transporter permease [unclassified Rhizobium]|uniref:ABC transporter permease n=1 Tax=unclassified Rhizobium TaxID=2613769 RepID=UPI0006FAEB89|nr:MULTISPECIES: ABC transporter permease [unclassified Rhizobium]KQV41773.1 ABC transporter permease [Rhizobium sp. Root1212]KRD30018.1 ABC transporter permease [Rhizobium sp. Root268]
MVEAPSQAHRRRRGVLDVTGQPGFRTIASICIGILYAPLVVLVLLSFNTSDLLTQFDGLSLQWYRLALANRDFYEAAKNTLIVATATTAATVLATAAALGMTRALRAWRGQTAAYTVINLPLMVPEIVVAIATLAFFSVLSSSLGISFGFGNLILTHTVFCIPVAYMPIRARLAGMDTSLDQAAADLYATPWHAFRRVTLPLLAPGIIAGAALAFIISFDNFTISQFVAGPGQSTLPLYIWGMIRKPITPEVNAMCSLLLAISILFIFASSLISRRRN